MKKESKKRKILSFVGIVMLAIIICFVVLNIYIYKMINKKSINPYFKCQEYIQLIYGYVQCIDYAEKSDINIEKSVEEKVKSSVIILNDMFEEYGYGLADTVDVARLGYMYSYYGLKNNKLKEYIDKCYIEDEKLFNGSIYQGESSKNSSYVYDTIETDRTLYNLSLIEEYNIKQGLIDWFNKNIEEKILTNEGLSDFYDIIWDFYIHSYDMNALKIEYLKDDAMEILEYCKEINGAEKLSFAEVGYLDEAIYLSDIYSYNFDFVKNDKETYRKLKSEEDF